MQMIEIKSEIIINANPGTIWKIMSEFEKYSEWNPFIVSVVGKVSIGNKIRIKITPPDASSMVFKPKVLEYKINEEIRWLGNFIFPGLFDGEHIFEIIENRNGTCTFVQREKFTGILVPLFKKMIMDNTKRGFELMNKKIKEKCE